MLSVRIHLNDILILFAHRILIAKLQCTSIPESKHIPDLRTWILVDDLTGSIC